MSPDTLDDTTRTALGLAPDIEEAEALRRLLRTAALDDAARGRIVARAAGLVRGIRTSGRPSMMERFLAEYGMTSDEGIALMCLAEALLRVPDAPTIDALIEDKIAPGDWAGHLGHAHSALVNGSTWALFLTGKVLERPHDTGLAAHLRTAVKRLGEPVIRQAVARIMKELGRQFVLGQTIQDAMARGRTKGALGYTHSYDMLGEAARTEADAARYHRAYVDAIAAISAAATGRDVRARPGISIKLSALHPRYETLQHDRVRAELLPRASELVAQAARGNIGLNIDAEEAGRLELSLELIEALVADAAPSGWEGFGVVVQAYNRRADEVIDWLHELAGRHDRRIMVRLVKGAYWDTEIKHAQVEGHEGFPVFTRKTATDVSYIACARKLLDMTDRLYPQFATHNAHTVAAVLEMAGNKRGRFEFQRLHGMGEALHDAVLATEGTGCRIYAPVGAHRDLLAYLVRRLLENGANSSFVHKIMDDDVPPERVAACPLRETDAWLARGAPAPALRHPADLFAPQRVNSRGWDLEDPNTLRALETGIAPFLETRWEADCGSVPAHEVTNPATGHAVGRVAFCSAEDAAAAAETVRDWSATPVAERSRALRAAADLYEAHACELFALVMREAGKTIRDAVAELREAVDFLRYYAAEAERIDAPPAGIFACISPWNFPLAIFTGQISAALATGNGVLAKPAEATTLVAKRATELLHEAGVPADVLRLVPGAGATVGPVLSGHPRIAGVCFTGSTATATAINRRMAEALPPAAPLIAETGGINAMVIDSTALPEQAVRDLVASAFQSAGQRCSACRVVYVQDDVADGVLRMLAGAMDTLRLGDPTDLATDVGPVIDEAARRRIEAHVEAARSEGRLIKQVPTPDGGCFVGPAAISVAGIEAVTEEIFGPVLHVARYRARDFERVLDRVNASGYGLTFCFHSRIDDRVQAVISRIRAGNVYVNRNQIGAVVGSQPFGGNGLSGTGPKAGGPKYLHRFVSGTPGAADPGEGHADGPTVAATRLAAALAAAAHDPSKAPEPVALPGPTGELNLYSERPRRGVLCLGPTADRAAEQLRLARAVGAGALAVAPGVRQGLDGRVDPDSLVDVPDLGAVVWWGDLATARSLRRALAAREGPIVPLLSMRDLTRWCLEEAHVCVDTTAAGGNAELLGDVEG